MKQCLICQAGDDQASLLRLPVTVEGNPLGDFLVCSACVELLGQEQIAALVRTAASEGAYAPENILAAPGAENSESAAPANETPAPRSMAQEVPAGVLNDPDRFGAWLGQQLAPLLLGQYQQGRGQVTLLTSLTQDENQFQFRAVLGD